MVFVDGTNFLVQLAEELGIRFRAEKPPPSAFRYARLALALLNTEDAIRWFWFASYQGNDDYRDKIRSKLREEKFEPVLFKKKNGREKGVDIALTKEMLVHAFNKNFDVGYLVAGDEDYVGLVNEVKRFGPIVRGTFFNHGLSNELRLTFDSFEYLGQNIWEHINREGYMQNIEEELRFGN
jgi:uncharacterized LabA/DUF88 family protein